MRNIMTRAFVGAEAIIGVVLTIFWLTEQWPPHAVFAPLCWIGAGLLFCALVVATWERASNRETRTVEQKTLNQPRAAARSRKLSAIVSQNRRPIEIGLAATFVFITALLIRYGTPLSGA